MRTLFAGAAVKTYAKNTIVIAEGDRNTDSIYLIRSGRVKVYLCNADGKEFDLDVLEPGDYFGEMELDGAPRCASVATLERSQLVVVRRPEFWKFVAEHPDFAMPLVLKMIARTRALLKNVKRLALLDVSDRVARLLLDMATEEGGKLIIAERLSKRDIANRVGATREMASRVFKGLVLSGYIELDKNHHRQKAAPARVMLGVRRARMHLRQNCVPPARRKRNRAAMRSANPAHALPSRIRIQVSRDPVVNRSIIRNAGRFSTYQP